MCVFVCVFKSESHILQADFELTEGSLELLIFLFLFPVGIDLYCLTVYVVFWVKPRQFLYVGQALYQAGYMPCPRGIFNSVDSNHLFLKLY